MVYGTSRGSGTGCPLYFREDIAELKEYYPDTLPEETKSLPEALSQMDYASSIQYNNENSLSSVLSIAYLSAMQYYFKPIREMPAGNGFADFVFIPKPEYSSFYPALVVKLKWNKDAATALQQIKNKRYPESILRYTGDPTRRNQL